MENNKYSWDSHDYARHSTAQFAWATELIAKLNLSGSENLLDMGCGDGKVSAALASMLPRGRVTAIDSSPDMIGLARETHAPDTFPNLTFLLKDVLDMDFSDAFDIAFSNAALHWVKDHERVLANTSRALKTGGRLLFQMGGRGNASEILDTFGQLMGEPAWRAYFEGFVFPYGFHGPEEYRPWLNKAGLREHRVELLPKDMTQAGKEGLAGWIRTTWLPYTRRVPEDLRGEFISAITDAYIKAHPADEKGFVHVPMVRLEVEAVKV